VQIRENLPPKAFATRIENKHGGGVPDVFLLWEGLPLWFELKVAKKNLVNLSPHQIAWHMAYYARGGLSFFLVKDLSTRDIVLFEGKMGPELRSNGLKEEQCSRFTGPAPLFEALRPRLLHHYEGLLRPAPRD
jgi:hypothetical protein